MNVCENEIRDAVEAELIDADEIYPAFASLYEAYCVTLGEFDEAANEFKKCKSIMKSVWDCTKNDYRCGAMTDYTEMVYTAQHLAIEACRVAAMAEKARQSLRELEKKMTAKDAMKIRNNPTAEDVDNEELQKCIDEALERQIPKKPKERHSVKWGDSYNDGECPNCGAVYSDSLSETPWYCSQCGQHFDWSDENETD